MKATRSLATDTRQRIEEVWRRLGEHYGHPTIRPTGDPVGELVGTILSQHTTDASSARALADLRARFPNWTAIETAPVDEVVAAIRFAGLPNQKAITIQTALREFGERDLAQLVELPVTEARARLTAIRGIGDKTASCVLLFALGMPAQPVDTHIERVSKRIGITNGEKTPSGIQNVLEACLPADGQTMFAFHVDLIRHGREICVARAPKCAACMMTDICVFFAQTRQPDA
jgi:endonuclease-3